MKGPEISDLRETALRRSLNPEEQARLEAYFLAHPNEKHIWEEDLAVHGWIRQLPDVPLSSNFTSQVLQVALQIRREKERKTNWSLPFPGWTWARATAAALALATAAGIFYQNHQEALRTERAESVVTLSTTIPPIELLQDFEAIHRLSQAPTESELDYLLIALE